MARLHQAYLQRKARWNAGLTNKTSLEIPAASLPFSFSFFIRLSTILPVSFLNLPSTPRLDGYPKAPACACRLELYTSNQVSF